MNKQTTFIALVAFATVAFGAGPHDWPTSDGKTVEGQLAGATTRAITIRGGNRNKSIPWSQLTEESRSNARSLLLVLEDPAPRVAATGIYTRIYPITRQARSVIPARTSGDESSGGEPDFDAVFKKHHIKFDNSDALHWHFNGIQLVVTQTVVAHKRIALALRRLDTQGAKTSPFGTLPVTGIESTAFAEIDRTFVEHIKHTNEEAIMLAVEYNGRLAYRAAYGWANEARTMPVDPDRRSLIASSIKAVTIRAIEKLLEDYNIDRDAKVIPILKLKPLRGRPFVKGVDQITINHLLNHRSGLPSKLARLAFVGKTMRLGRDATETEAFAWQLSQPLRFQPGAGNLYSNAGYMLLGLVMEAVTGTSAVQYMQDTQMTPHGAYSLHPTFHNLVYSPASWKRTTNPCAGAAWITAQDYLRWFSRYDPGRSAPPAPPRRGVARKMWVGATPGVARSVMVMLRRPGKKIHYAIIQFQRGKKRKPKGALNSMLEKALLEMGDWPDHDLFEIEDPRAAIPRRLGEE